MMATPLSDGDIVTISHPTLRIAFREAAQPITQPVTKFGGKPVWITGPQWPLSARTRKPMMFIAQIALDPRVFPHTAARMAYVFMNRQGDYDTFDPDGGENAVILQPASPPVPHSPLMSGPCIEKRLFAPGTDDFTWQEAEFAVDLSLQQERAFVALEQRGGWPADANRQYEKALQGHKIGGAPYFFQNDEIPFEEWHLILQLDSVGLPFFINFGDGGIGYAFANADFTKAKFLWQCA
jgi:hypothetical protein